MLSKCSKRGGFNFDEQSVEWELWSGGATYSGVGVEDIFTGVMYIRSRLLPSSSEFFQFLQKAET